MGVGDLYFNTETVQVIFTPPNDYWGTQRNDIVPRLRYIVSKTIFLELLPFPYGTRKFMILSKNGTENLVCWLGTHELHYLMELGKNGWGIEDEG